MRRDRDLGRVETDPARCRGGKTGESCRGSVQGDALPQPPAMVHHIRPPGPRSRPSSLKSQSIVSLGRRAVRTSIAVGGIPWESSSFARELDTIIQLSWPVNVTLRVRVTGGPSYCHGCGSHGNQLELWAAVIKLPLHQAAIDLCHRLGRGVPWIRRW